MSVKEERLWKILEQKTREEDGRLQPSRRISDEYLSKVELVCDFAIERAKTIRDTFPMYTLHDETHICNVLRIINQLLGDRAGELTRDEAAMLILAACCHDVGMSYSQSEKENLLQDRDRLNEYLERNHSEYVKAYAKNSDEPELTDEILRNYLRSIHHEHILEVLNLIEWPGCLWGKVDRDDLVRVCRSHGEDSSQLNDLESTSTVDLRFCAVLLRLADILDFDTTRAPEAVYQYCGFNHTERSEVRISREEWKKHMASQGFDFIHVADRSMPYDLPYHATSESMQIERAVHSYLDWVDEELNRCGALLRKFAGRWQSFVLPSKIKRTIKAKGYVSGQYHLTMDQDKVMELLVGEDLYSDPSAFVRELIQNAIDAVRTREQLDRQLPRGWRPQISIRSWMDEEGYHWFRIEDNGTGMTKEILENYFLKIGRSYYTSDTFEKEKVQCGADPNYTPISRFGIGILSCFMGGKDSNQVEVSTKRFGVGGERPSALRLSMHGMNGYYYLASKREGHDPGPMKGETDLEKKPYLQEPGTVVAVRTNLYQAGKYTGFKEIVDRYVVYPGVPVHYDGPEGSFDYVTKDKFMEVVHDIRPSDDLSQQGILEFPMTGEQMQELRKELPGICFEENPKIVLKCVPLDRYTKSPYLSGAVVCAKAVGNHDVLSLQIEGESIELDVVVSVVWDKKKEDLGINVALDLTDSNGEKMDIPEEWGWLENEYSTTVCHLLDLSWYKMYFLDTYSRVGLDNIAAHNGIFCGDGRSLFDTMWKEETLGAIVLLEDQYRPGVDVSRSEIRELSLEMACDIVLIGKMLMLEGFYVRESLRDLLRNSPCLIPSYEYESLLQKRLDLKERIMLYAMGDYYIWDEIEKWISQHKVLRKQWSHFKWGAWYPTSCNPMDLKEQLLFACLKRYFRVRMSISTDSDEICVLERAKTCVEPENNIFPPSLFIYPETECRYLTRGWVGERHFCNAEHRLSQFMLNNADAMQKRVPGLLKELIRILQQESGEGLVSGVNDILARLRCLPGQPIPVPWDVYLTMEDLCLDQETPEVGAS